MEGQALRMPWHGPPQPSSSCTVTSGLIWSSEIVSLSLSPSRDPKMGRIGKAPLLGSSNALAEAPL